MDGLEAELLLEDGDPLVRGLVVDFQTLLDLILLVVVPDDEAGEDLGGRGEEFHVVDLLGLGVDPAPAHALDHDLVRGVQDQEVGGHHTARALLDLVAEEVRLGLAAGEPVEDPAAVLAGLELRDHGGDDELVGHKLAGGHHLGDLLADLGAGAGLGAEDVTRADDGEVVVLAHGLALSALAGSRRASDNDAKCLRHFFI